MGLRERSEQKVIVAAGRHLFIQQWRRTCKLSRINGMRKELSNMLQNVANARVLHEHGGYPQVGDCVPFAYVMTLQGWIFVVMGHPNAPSQVGYTDMSAD